MSTTTAKHREFISEPMGDKSITSVAGIGPVYGQKLIDKGYDKAYVLLGQFLLYKKEKDLFIEWFRGLCGANSHYAKSAYDCLNEWCKTFV